jgi:hypothetical protein
MHKQWHPIKPSLAATGNLRPGRFCRHSMAAAWLSGAACDRKIEPSFDLGGVQFYKPAREQL